MKALLKRVTTIAALLVTGAGTATAADGPAWRDCYDGLSCTEIEVPADWDDPARATVTVPLLRIPARDRKLGTLLVNPGGPAQSIPLFAVPGYRDQFTGLAARFDVVVFDPRGLDVTCPAPVPAPLPGPLTRSAYDAYTAANAEFAADCTTAAGAVRGHLGADQVARDMDAIRARLGERRLNYFGSSYGTVYGQAYAARFGSRVGRMYLDSVLDHTRPDPAAWARAGAVTAERNLARMARWCAAEAGCALHGRDVIAVWDGLMATPDAPAIVAWAAARIGSDTSWPALTAGLASAAAGDTAPATPRPSPPDARLARTAFCADFPSPDGFRAAKGVEDELRAAAPRLGWAVHPWRVSGQCAGLPRIGVNPPAALPPVPRILVANGDDDPLTPAEHGRRVAGQLGGRYLPSAGGHALYLRGNACVRGHVHRWLENAEWPAAGARC
ncbi:alpha/beta fold hydrolase [Amycolatopsis sp.]|uniref:alpha/beta fold hydrolase n=1 Tax=Amycolatopsis sp. TaxID=37632 RepID=UPI002D805391|nr:alpha/beta fold hydrolase [Amycolatopsis sp.]HET6707641.1 alpha/beta fold hydrolase [Amycolatopsis sp.]